MSSTSPQSLNDRLAALVETAPDAGFSSSDEAQAMLEQLQQADSDLSTFLTRKGHRLPAAQQLAIARLFQAADASAYAPVLQQWSCNPALPLTVRATCLNALTQLGTAPDVELTQAVQQAEALAQNLGATAAEPLTDDGALEASWSEQVLTLPVAVALDVARELTPDTPRRALAVLDAVEPAAAGPERLTLVDRLAAIPLPETAATLQNLLIRPRTKRLKKRLRKRCIDSSRMV